MPRFSELTDEELRAKAEKLGIKRVEVKTRDQLEAEILEVEPEATDESVQADTSMADRGDFSTPVKDQGSVPSGADDEPRPNYTEIPGNGEPADQSSAGGTGGDTVTTADTTTPAGDTTI